MRMRHYEVVIIGGGPGGCTAALYCARAGLRTLVLEKLSVGGQLAVTAMVENYPGVPEGVTGGQLADQMQRGAAAAGAEFCFAEATVLALIGRPKRIETSEGALTADAVILAGGASPRPLGVPDEASLVGHGLSYCATCDGAFFRGRTVAVVGGGNSAAEEAATLARLCQKVYLVHRRAQLRAGRREQDNLHAADNVELVLEAAVEQVLHGAAVTGLRLRHTSTGAVFDLPCDGVFVAIGRIPETALVRGQVPLDESGYILADEHTRTSLPGVFAVGDIRRKPVRQIVTATADGATAARCAEEYLRAHLEA